MRDNKTSQAAQDYNANIGKTIPYYNLFHDETLSLVKAVNPNPMVWLDAGCGTGNLVEKAAAIFTDTHFVLMDPSAAMLDIAKQRFACNDKLNLTYLLAGTEKILSLPFSHIIILVGTPEKGLRHIALLC